jgi:hypothetical protein
VAVLLAFAFSPAALAKKHTFSSGIPFGLGFRAGISQNPDTDLVAQPRSTSSGFTPFFGFEPFLDFGNFAIRFSGQLHSMPVVSGTGPGSTYSETSDVSSFLYGVHLQLAPYISESDTNRAYIKLGLSQAIARGENKRTYTGGTAYTEKFEGKTRELLLGAGFEFFLVQNYSMQIEAGARQLEFERLTSRGGTDLSGATKNSGDPLLNADGSNKKLNQSSAYFSVGLNLNF